MQEKFGLLAFFDRGVAEIIRRYCSPVDLTQLIKSFVKICVVRTRVAGTECPTAMIDSAPLDNVSEVRLNVDYRSLSTFVSQFRMITSKNQIQHDRTWAEIKRDIIPDSGSWMTVHVKVEPPLFD